MSSASGVALDVVNRKVYVSGYLIRRADLDGSNVETIHSTAISKSIAVDPVAGMVYWTSHSGVILRRRTDLTAPAETFAGVPFSGQYFDPRGLAVDGAAGQVYWISGSAFTSGIFRAPTSDGSLAVNLTSGLRFPQDVALDPAGSRLFWVDPHEDAIFVSALDASGATPLVSGLGDPFGFAVDPNSDRIFWTDERDLTLNTALLSDGSGQQEIARSTAAFPVGITVDPLERLFWVDLRFGDPDVLRRAAVDGSGTVDLLNPTSARGLAHDPVTGKVYWAESSQIVRANPDGTSIETVISGLSSPLGIAVDPIERYVYWASGAAGAVRRASLSGGAAEDVATGRALPRGLAVDPAGGKVYWTEFTSGLVVRANLDGSSLEVLHTGQNRPYGIAFDPAGSIYWAAGDEIRRSDPDGLNEGLFLVVPGEPAYLALSARYDFGDAPEALGYPTLITSSGAAHRHGSGLYLGEVAPDPEADGQPDPMAQGDDSDGVDDEDGVEPVSTLFSDASATSTGSLKIAASGDAHLSLFLDTDRSGSWSTPDESLYSGPVSSGTTLVPVAVPPGLAAGPVFLRSRICSTGDCSAPTGVSGDGEVEDHVLEIASGPTDVTIRVPDAGTINPIIVDRTGAETLRVRDGFGLILFEAPFALINSLSVEGSSRPDHLLVDWSGGTPIPPDGISFEGGDPVLGPGDLLRFEEGVVADVVHTLIDESSGSVNVDGRVVAYTGLEPVVDLLLAGNRSFHFTGGSETIVLSDDGTAGDGISVIDSDLSESVSFVNPTGALLVSAGTGADTVIFDAFDSAAILPTTFVLEGNGDADLFRVRPAATHGLFVDGGAPSACPGDILELMGGPYDGQLLTMVSPGTGNWSFDTRGTVSFTDIEIRADAVTDVSVTAAWDMSTGYPADEREVTFTLTNNGSDEATCLSAEITLPSALNVISTAEDYPATAAGLFAAGTWTIDRMLSGDSASISFRGVMDALMPEIFGTTINAAADVPSDDQALGNNIASADFELLNFFRFPAKAAAISAQYVELPSGLDRVVAGLFQGSPGFNTPLLCRIPDADGVLFTQPGVGDHWKPCGAGLPLPLHVTDLFLDDRGTPGDVTDDRLWLASWGLAGLYYSDDYGETFVAAEPVLGPKGGWANVYSITKGIDQILYISANSGNVYRSLNGGGAWQQAASLPGASADTPWSTEAHPTESGTVYAGTFGRGVYVTTDYGFTWAPLGAEAINDDLLDPDNSGNDFAGHVFDMAFSPDGADEYLFIGTGKGVWRLDLDAAGVPTGTWEQMNLSVTLDDGTLVVPEIRVLAFDEDSTTPDPDDDLLVGSWGLGVFVNEDPIGGAAFSATALREGRVSMLLVTPAGDVMTGLGELGMVTISSEAASSTGTQDGDPVLPEGFGLGQNFPNPFNPTTTIGFELAETGHVRLAVYDVLGREVALLASGTLEAGVHHVRFDATDLPSATYMYRLQTGQGMLARQLVLMK